MKSLKEESVKLQNKVAKSKGQFDSSEANVEIEIKRANDAAQEAAPYLQLEEYVKAEKERMEIQSRFDLDATLRSYRRVYREIIDDLLGDFRALKDRLVDEVQVPREQLPVTPPPSALSVRENEEEGEEVVSQVAEDVAPGGVRRSWAGGREGKPFMMFFDAFLSTVHMDFEKVAVVKHSLLKWRVGARWEPYPMESIGHCIRSYHATDYSIELL